MGPVELVLLIVILIPIVLFAAVKFVKWAWGAGERSDA